MKNECSPYGFILRLVPGFRFNLRFIIHSSIRLLMSKSTNQDTTPPVSNTERAQRSDQLYQVMLAYYSERFEGLRDLATANERRAQFAEREAATYFDLFNTAAQEAERAQGELDRVMRSRDRVIALCIDLMQVHHENTRALVLEELRREQGQDPINLATDEEMSDEE